MTPAFQILSARCYCGAMRLEAKAPPLTTTYCHCSDCRRISGAPVSAFACFTPEAIDWHPALDNGVSHTAGVRRWFCRRCGSPLAAEYDYLPGQVYVPIGLFDDASVLEPAAHSHHGSRLTWLHLQDDLPRSDGSGRARLNEAGS